jgi:mannitol/fructose-specific phosphotransferase system IIA component (Ntr-type)
MIRSLVDAAQMIDELAAKTKDAALKEMLAVAQQSGALPAKSLKPLGKLLSDREALGSTGLGNGVAVPHLKGADVARTALVVARSRAGLDWHAIDGRNVHIAFLLVSPAAEPESHLKCLRWIAGLARHADFRRFFAAAAGGSAMRQLLAEMIREEPT